jgi:hypothetical protein
MKPLNLVLVMLASIINMLAAAEKLRVVVTTDFPPIGVVKGGNVPNDQKSDPDDMQSIVRYLLYSNEFDTEALIVSSGTFANKARKQNMLDVIDRYAKVYDNLKKHDPDYPTPESLRSITYEGRSGTWGKKGTDNIGEGKDSEASNALIAIVDKPDPRPVYVSIWGDCSVVAQSVWKVQNTRTKADLDRFLGKLRIHQIATQDGTIGWLRDNFPKLFIIHSAKTYQGMFGGNDPDSNLDWVNRHIRHAHGPLCEIYPHEGMGCTGVCEGDTPAFLWLVSANRGLNDPDDPTQESWGGQFKKDGGKNHFIDGPGPSSISKWRKAYQREFQERADWCVNPPEKSKAQASHRKPRVIHTTDLGADPDDKQSMVRQLVSANEFDIEGLIVATGCWKKNQSNTAMLDELVDGYGKVVKNLSVHAEGFPSHEYLKSISVMGQKGYGMSDVGEGKDSPGSELIIASVDKDDSRPVWVTGWGGMNTIAQAIWKAKSTRTPEEFKKFLSKLRCFDILGQDDAGAWIAKNFPDLFYIRATGVYGWAPSDQYLDDHIQNHGPLGALYPDRKWATEGDTPAFMHIYPNGLNDPEQIDQGGWGGRFSFTKKAGIRSMSEVAKINKQGEPQFDPYLMYGNTPEKAKAIKRWSKGYNNNFAARMDWSITSKYEDANHHPIAIVDGDKTRKVIKKSVPPGSVIELSAVGSSDPDDNELTYSWSFYEDPGSYAGSVIIENGSSQIAKVTIPSDSAGKDLHVILKVHDDGAPNLYAYRRVIFTVGQ